MGLVDGEGWADTKCRRGGSGSSDAARWTPAGPRVLLVTARYPPHLGGIETHVFEVARRLACAGVGVTVLTTDVTGGLPTEEECEGVQVKRVRAWPANRDYYFAPGVYRAIRDGDWDVVHCQGCHTLVAPLAMLAAWRAQIPYVLTFHTGGHSSRFRQTLRGMQWAMLRPLLARAERLIGVSKFEAQFFQTRLRLPAARFAVIPNGAQLPQVQERAPAAGPGALVISVGRLERYKGHQRMIAALPKIRAQRPDVRLLILGTGPYEATLREMAARLGVADSVEITAIPAHERERMASVLSGAALVTLLSEYEAHPIAVMEAAALGRPVLVADTSGLRELAEQGFARAIPLASTAEEVAAAVLNQLGQPLAPARIDLPTWDGCTAALLDLYRTVARRAQCAS